MPEGEPKLTPEQEKIMETRLDNDTTSEWIADTRNTLAKEDNKVDGYERPTNLTGEDVTRAEAMAEDRKREESK